MTPTERPIMPFPSVVPSAPIARHRVLLVDDDDAVRDMMAATLERKGFGVVAATNVTEALKLVTTETFDVLITDLHMPSPGDGFTVVTAMRHSQPNALTLLVSGYPDVQSAMAAILLQADEIIVKPFDVGKLAELVRDKMLTRLPVARLEKQRVAEILHRSISNVVADWLARAKNSSELNLIGKTTDEAVDLVDKFLDQAFLNGQTEVRIIHGHGTGALRKAVAELLSDHPHVARFKTAPQDQGGSGATIVELRQ